MNRKTLKNLLSLLAFLVVSIAGAQTLKGKVIDDQNEPLLGVTILVKEVPNKGATTNEKGEFSINVTPNQTLVFSYIGFQSKEIKVGKQKNLVVTLVGEAEELPPHPIAYMHTI